MELKSAEFTEIDRKCIPCDRNEGTFTQVSFIHIDCICQLLVCAQ